MKDTAGSVPRLPAPRLCVWRRGPDRYRGDRDGRSSVQAARVEERGSHPTAMAVILAIRSIGITFLASSYHSRRPRARRSSRRSPTMSTATPSASSRSRKFHRPLPFLAASTWSPRSRGCRRCSARTALPAPVAFAAVADYSTGILAPGTVARRRRDHGRRLDHAPRLPLYAGWRLPALHPGSAWSGHGSGRRTRVRGSTISVYRDSTDCGDHQVVVSVKFTSVPGSSSCLIRSSSGLCWLPPPVRRAGRGSGRRRGCGLR